MGEVNELVGRVGRASQQEIRLQGLCFSNVDEFSFLEDSIATCSMKTFEGGPVKGVSVDQ